MTLLTFNPGTWKPEHLRHIGLTDEEIAAEKAAAEAAEKNI
jgi:hypothetical protein